MSRWFRFYDDVMDDPKVQLLSDAHYRGWTTLLCLASKNDGEIPGDEAVLCFALRKPAGKVRDLLATLLTGGLIDKTETGYTPHNWAGRQYKSDVSTDRVKQHRERHKKHDGNVSRNGDETANETPPETEQRQSRAETEQKEEGSAVASRTALPAVLGSVFIELPTNRFESNGEEVPIYEPFVEEMQRLYPAVDVPEQLRFMRGWLVSNPGHRKTRTGMKRFINGWLSRQQDRGGAPRETIRGNGNGRGKPPSAHDKFNAGAALFIASLGGDADGRGEAAGGGDPDRPQLPLLAS
jgi:hypothetical protein